MLNVQCPRCGQILVVDASLFGKLSQCPKCAQQFTIPASAQSSPPAPPPVPQTAAPQPPPVPQQIAAGAPPVPLAPPPTPNPSVDPLARENRPRRRKRRRRRKRQAGPLDAVQDTFYYWTASFGIFPWILGGLIFIWFILIAATLLAPSLGILMVVYGIVLYLLGWMWFVWVAFQDDAFHGVLVFFTQFYWLVYFFINMHETLRPTILMVFGIIVAAAGVIMVLAHMDPAVAMD